MQIDFISDLPAQSGLSERAPPSVPCSVESLRSTKCHSDFFPVAL